MVQCDFNRDYLGKLRYKVCGRSKFLFYLAIKLSIVYKSFYESIMQKTLSCYPNKEEKTCQLYCVQGGLMFVDFVGHPYPRIYVPSNLYFIIQISKHNFYHFKQSLCTLEIDDGYVH